MHSMTKSWKEKFGMNAHALPMAESLIAFSQYTVTFCSVFPVAVGHFGSGPVVGVGCCIVGSGGGGFAGGSTVPIFWGLHAFAVGCRRRTDCPNVS